MNDNPTNADEQYELGEKYFYRDGVPEDWEKMIYWCTGTTPPSWNRSPQDLEKAVYWFTKAAEQGNESTAIYWFTKDAEQGNEIVQLNLGYFYANGNGVPKDLEKARYWLTKVAEQNGEAAENAKKMLTTMHSLH